MDRTAIATLIVQALEPRTEALRQEFSVPGRIPSCHVTDLLPRELARAIYEKFPPSEKMTLYRSIKENKHIAVQMDDHDTLLEEAVFAFQDPRVVKLVGKITGMVELEPDENLYAGGISAMMKGAYLRPHLDNSHDRNRQRYRVLNLLYYVTPEWSEEYGGSLQLWDQGPTGQPRTLPASFNSLAIMAMNRDSWHSVNEIRYEGRRCCVSNYYFSRVSPGDSDYFHATSFRAEPGHRWADLVMRADNATRTWILNFLGGLYKNPHVYKRSAGRDTSTDQ